MSNWSVYIVGCSDGSLYTGVTTDVERRVHEHNNTRKGAKYTRARRPVELVWSQYCVNKSTAYKLEDAIKRLGRKMKVAIVEGRRQPPCKE